MYIHIYIYIYIYNYSSCPSRPHGKRKNSNRSKSQTINGTSSNTCIAHTTQMPCFCLVGFGPVDRFCRERLVDLGAMPLFWTWGQCLCETLGVRTFFSAGTRVRGGMCASGCSRPLLRSPLTQHLCAGYTIISTTYVSAIYRKTMFVQFPFQSGVLCFKRTFHMQVLGMIASPPCRKSKAHLFCAPQAQQSEFSGICGPGPRRASTADLLISVIWISEGLTQE